MKVLQYASSDVLFGNSPRQLGHTYRQLMKKKESTTVRETYNVLTSAWLLTSDVCYQ